VRKFLLPLFFLSAVFCLYAQDAGDEAVEKGPRGFFRGMINYLDNPQVTTRHLDRKRIFELQLFDLEAEFGNNLISLGDFFKKEILIDIDKLDSRINDKGAGMNMGFGFAPMRISVNPTQRWGGEFGLDTSGRFDVTIPKELITLLSEGNASRRKSSGEFIISGSFFYEIGFNVHGTLPILDSKLTIGIDPAYYSPLLYIPRSGLGYTLDTDESLLLSSGGGFRAYMPLNIDAVEPGDFFKSFGIDLSLSAEYALFSRLDLGISLSHIPLVPARLDTGYEFVLSETEIIRLDDINKLDMDDVIKSPEITGGGDFISLPAIKVFRPLRVDFYNIFRPFKNDFLSIRPNIGFTALTAGEEVYFNMGNRVTLDLARIFAVYIDSGREEGLWQHKLGFELNLRAFELDFETALRSQSYLTSWNASGISARLGIAFGW
jgi:hypothetical protein